MKEQEIDDQLVVYGRKFSSHLLLGTARYEPPSRLDPAMLAVSLQGMAIMS